MKLVTLAALLLAYTASAATISSITCPGTGCFTVNVSGSNGLSVHVTGTWVGSIVVEGSNNGSTFSSLRGCPVAGGDCTAIVSSSGLWYVPTAGVTYVRLRASAWTSGTATITAEPTWAPAPPLTTQVAGNVTSTLDQATLDAMADPECSRTPWQGMPVDAGLSEVPYALPDGGGGPLADRTQAVIRYISDKGFARCDCLDVGQPVPTCSAARWYGTTLRPGDVATWSNMRAATPCYCIVCDDDAGGYSTIEILEGACR